MTLFHLTSAVFYTFFIWPTAAYPHEWHDSPSTAQHSPLYPRSQHLSLPSLNVTFTVPNKIHCYVPKPGRSSTSIDGCRPTLNYIRTFPKYRTVQDFLEGWWPKDPSLPPYAIHHEDSSCAVKIASFDCRVPDRFSFEMVRQKATDILTDCEANGGIGGISTIGRGVGWTVAVIGIEEPESTGVGAGKTS